MPSWPSLNSCRKTCPASENGGAEHRKPAGIAATKLPEFRKAWPSSLERALPHHSAAYFSLQAHARELGTILIHSRYENHSYAYQILVHSKEANIHYYHADGVAKGEIRDHDTLYTGSVEMR